MLEKIITLGAMGVAIYFAHKYILAYSIRHLRGVSHVPTTLPRAGAPTPPPPAMPGEGILSIFIWIVLIGLGIWIWGLLFSEPKQIQNCCPPPVAQTTNCCPQQSTTVAKSKSNTICVFNLMTVDQDGYTIDPEHDSRLATVEGKKLYITLTSLACPNMRIETEGGVVIYDSLVVGNTYVLDADMVYYFKNKGCPNTSHFRVSLYP